MKTIFIAKTYTLSVCLLLFICISCSKKKDYLKKTTDSSALIQLEYEYKTNLSNCYSNLDSILVTKSLQQKRAYYIKARKYFKTLEPLFSYLEKDNYKSINSPNLLRVQEEDATDIKINNPFGFQVIEENLFCEIPDLKTLIGPIKQTSGRLRLIHKNTQLNLKKHHLLWILKDAIIRISTTGLSNFDSPVLGQSLNESSDSYQGVLDLITAYQNEFNNKELFNKWVLEIKASQKQLAHDFDSFNRYSFIQNHTNKQLVLWNETVTDWNVTFPFEMALSNNFNSLFEKEMFNISYFSDYQNDTTYNHEKIILGKKLFNDKKLSLKNNMSCATCHIKELAFTDGKKTFDKNQIRNTPTLTYATLQRSFFYDGRSGSLEGQIVGVVNNHNEFNSTLKLLTKVVSQNKDYKKAFDTLYIRKGTDQNIRHAIASYIRTLNTFDSKFDNNINKTETTLSRSEKNGFNLFMGKAACATCHFPPLFNGTVPPNFIESELELIGVTKTNDFENPIIDSDFGRYELFKTPERKYFFKTPTLRNIALTAPYMHNGAFNTLEEVMEFYNKGGGNGLGLEIEFQTLPFDNLDLSDQEIKDIIAFMKTLTDS